MTITVYHPESEKDIETQRKEVAKIHAEYVIDYLEKLQCPKEQKFALIQALQRRALSLK